MHKTGQKRDRKGQEDVVGLAIFDFKMLQQDSSTTIFRVSDILKFLEREGRPDLIKPKPQQWARNCDEYVSLGGISQAGLVNWVTWEKIWSPSLFLPRCFMKAYTLGKYREWIQDPKNQRQATPEEINRLFSEFGMVLAGPRQDLLSPLLQLLQRPGLLFWGFTKDMASTDAVAATLQTLSITD